jgi:glycosyltransferase involved in cell wall biosynthesis
MSASALASAEAAPASRAPAPRLLHVFPSFGIGGVPVRIATILNHFGARYRHAIVALDGDMRCRERLAPGLDAALLTPGIDKRRPLATLARIRAILAGTPHELLLTYNWGAIEWALVNRLTLRRPHVHFESGFGPEEADGQIGRRVLLRRYALARSERVVVPSQVLLRLARDVWKLDPRRVSYIPNGVDVARFAAPPNPRALPVPGRAAGEALIGTLAPLRREKNIGRLVRAFARLPAEILARLVIIGDGAERAGIEALAAELGVRDRTVFAGYIAAPETVLGLLDVFAMSSDTEQMPNTLLQAMAAGRAVAATDVGDVREILSPDNRPFVVARDDGALAAAIGRLAADPALRARLGAANQERVRTHYALDAMCAAYGALFEASLARAARLP